MYEATTSGVTVTVTPRYLEDRSSPVERRWVFAYTVEIANGSSDPLQLRTRYWHITDGEGRVEEVRGPGVVGEEPMLAPGDSYTYTSACPLGTPSGIMRGAYGVERPDGSRFEVTIPAFSLDAPAERPRVLN